MSESPIKHRAFIFEIYPEGDNCPDDWHERLRNSMLALAISPLHKADDETSTPHYHVIYYSRAPLTDESVFRRFIDTGLIEEMTNPEGKPKLDGVVANGKFFHDTGSVITRCRYLLHLDDPQKEQFEGDPFELIETMRDFPLTLTPPPSREERLHLKREVFGYIRDLNIKEYSDLLESLLDNEQFEMFEYASSQTVMFNGYLTSRRHRDEHPQNITE